MNALPGQYAPRDLRFLLLGGLKLGRIDWLVEGGRLGTNLGRQFPIHLKPCVKRQDQAVDFPEIGKKARQPLGRPIRLFKR